MKRLLLAIFLIILSLLPATAGIAAPPPPEPAAALPISLCHFGITAPYASNEVDLSLIGVDSYLDWNSGTKKISTGADYVRVVSVRDAVYVAAVANMAAKAKAYPGSVWLIGNEPDEKKYQDNLTPEIYAERYYVLTNIIRANDPTAKVGFGTVVQPTPIRLRYLDRALAQLSRILGNPGNVSAYIDFWSIHAFVLNEIPGEWGCGIPPGFENDYADAIQITNFADTYSIDIFKQRIQDFRTWMKAKGEQNKPLWISEYGSLFPPIDLPGIDYVNVSDESTSAFMTATFDYMLSTKDANLGYAPDENRLVQKWFWYSLNDRRDNFGGTLYDRLSKSFTPVGTAFIGYQPPLGAVTPVVPDITPISLVAVPQKFTAIGSPGVDYTLYARVDNLVRSDLQQEVTVKVFQNDIFIDTIPVTGWVNRCGGGGIIKLNWLNQLPNTSYNLRVDVEAVDETIIINNSQIFSVTTAEPILTYVPMVLR